MIRILEGDHNLRIGLVGVQFGLEGLCRAERETGRDDAILLAGTERVAHERVLDHVFKAVVQEIG